MDGWEGIQEILAARRMAEPRRTLLRGLLHCSAGAPMHGRVQHYSCNCEEDGRPHRGMSAQKTIVEPAVQAAVAELLSVLPAIAFVAAPARARSTETIASELGAVRRELREKLATQDDLLLRAVHYQRLPGMSVERHIEMLSVVGREIEAAQKREQQLTARHR